MYCPRGSVAPTFIEAGFYTVGGYNIAVDGLESTGLEIADRAVNASNGQAGVLPNDARGAAFRSGAASCPAGWYCAGDGGGRECPPGFYGSEVLLYEYTIGTGRVLFNSAQTKRVKTKSTGVVIYNSVILIIIRYCSLCSPASCLRT